MFNKTTKHLPEDIILLIVTFLSLNDMMMFRGLSKYLYVLTDKQTLWSYLIKEEFYSKLDCALSPKTQPYHDYYFYKCLKIMTLRKINLYPWAIENLTKRECWNSATILDYEDLIILTSSFVLQNCQDAKLLTTCESYLTSLCNTNKSQPQKYNLFLGLRMGFLAKRIQSTWHESDTFDEDAQLLTTNYIYLLDKIAEELADMVTFDIKVNVELLKAKPLDQIIGMLSASNFINFLKFCITSPQNDIQVTCDKHYGLFFILYLLPKHPDDNDLNVSQLFQRLIGKFININERNMIRLFNILFTLHKNLPRCSLSYLIDLSNSIEEIDIEVFCNSVMYLIQPLYLARLQQACEKWNIQLNEGNYPHGKFKLLENFMLEYHRRRLPLLGKLTKASDKAWENFEQIICRKQIDSKHLEIIINGITHSAFEIMTQQDFAQIRILSLLAILKTNSERFQALYSALKKECPVQFQPSVKQIEGLALLTNSHEDSQKSTTASQMNPLKRKCEQLENDIKKIKQKKTRLSQQISKYRYYVKQLKGEEDKTVKILYYTPNSFMK